MQRVGAVFWTDQPSAIELRSGEILNLCGLGRARGWGSACQLCSPGWNHFLKTGQVGGEHHSADLVRLIWSFAVSIHDDAGTRIEELPNSTGVHRTSYMGHGDEFLGPVMEESFDC